MPKIASVQVCIVSVPLDKVTSIATRTIHDRHYALVKIRSVDGIEGIGFCYVGSVAGHLASVAISELLAPILIGQESTCTEALWTQMYRESLLQGRSGTIMRAISILDIALWDLNARTAKMRLSNFMGCWTNDLVPAYASGGYYLDGKTPEHLGEELEAFVAQGFKAVKMKVGRLTPREEEARVRAARLAIGDDVLLMLDANNAWTDLPDALQTLRRLEDYNPYFIEEPFSPDDIDSHVRLTRHTTIPVATGEIESGRWRFKELLDKGGAHFLQADAAVCGGITEWRRIAAIADSSGVPMLPHWFHDLHIHLVASAPNARYVEFFPDDQVLNFRRLIDRQLEFKDGHLALPSGHGLGFQFDEDAVSQYSDGKSWTVVQ